LCCRVTSVAHISFANSMGPCCIARSQRSESFPTSPDRLSPFLIPSSTLIPSDFVIWSLRPDRWTTLTIDYIAVALRRRPLSMARDRLRNHATHPYLASKSCFSILVRFVLFFVLFLLFFFVVCYFLILLKMFRVESSFLFIGESMERYETVYPLKDTVHEANGRA
jgi:hypothetical protein